MCIRDRIRIVMRELLVSLNYLHSQGLVHKDVKLENLVFQKKGGVEPRSVTKEKAPLLLQNKQKF